MSSSLVPALSLLSSIGLFTLEPAGAEAAQADDRGPNHTVWSYTTEESHNGQRMLRHHSFVEIGSGLNYNKDGQWLPSKEEIEVFKDGAVARQGQHTVIWSPNINTAGSVDMSMSDGRRLRSHIVGLAYTDSASGHSELIAEPKDCIGAVAGNGPNQVVYLDAFNGPFHADVVYLYSVGGLEQFVILNENPPSPAEYQCDPATTFLEVWTEFVEAPEPVK